MPKHCPKCSTTKRVSAFCRSATRYDGLQPICRECSREVAREFRKENPIKTRNRDKTARKRDLLKNRARQRVRYAIKTGKMKRLPCAFCKSKNTEAHHKDYRNPLDVVFLCPACHKSIHFVLNSIKRACSHRVKIGAR